MRSWTLTGLNIALNWLREALDDSAEEPRDVNSVPGHHANRSFLLLQEDVPIWRIPFQRGLDVQHRRRYGPPDGGYMNGRGRLRDSTQMPNRRVQPGRAGPEISDRSAGRRDADQL